MLVQIKHGRCNEGSLTHFQTETLKIEKISCKMADKYKCEHYQRRCGLKVSCNVKIQSFQRINRSFSAKKC